jgi:hypothetical protein
MKGMMQKTMALRDAAVRARWGAASSAPKSEIAARSKAAEMAAAERRAAAKEPEDAGRPEEDARARKIIAALVVGALSATPASLRRRWQARVSTPDQRRNPNLNRYPHFGWIETRIERNSGGPSAPNQSGSQDVQAAALCNGFARG